MRTYHGSCHCGRVRFEIETELTAVVECNCSICSKKGILHHRVPPERFRLLAGEDALAVYRFNTATAQHLFCRHCGTFVPALLRFRFVTGTRGSLRVR